MLFSDKHVLGSMEECLNLEEVLKYARVYPQDRPHNNYISGIFLLFERKESSGPDLPSKICCDRLTQLLH